MKKYFKKSLAVFMAMLMLLSVVGVSALAAQYKLEYLPGRYSTDDAIDAIMVEGNTTVTLLGATYTREGYIQAGWSTAQAGTKKNYDLGGSLKITKNTKLYPYWEAVKYDVTFAPGANGTGIAIIDEADHGKTIKFPGAVFTREGYIQIGWSSVDGGELEYGNTASTPAITGDITFYPVWQECIYSVDVNLSEINFGFVCEDYASVAAEELVITNEGNMTINYTLPSDSSYVYTIKSGSLTLTPGSTLVVAIAPADGLGAGDYAANLYFDCDVDACDVNVAATFTVSAHSFDRYVSNNDASYDADGTMSAECSNGCGVVDTIIDAGSMKIYSADNNTAEGLLDEYLYHKTIRATAYGSGMDNIQPDGTIAFATTRYRPVSWYVDEEFNGTFEDDNYEINFVHTTYGYFTLTISYVEEIYVCDNRTGPHYFCEECGELTGKTCEFCGVAAMPVVCDICHNPACGNALYEEGEKIFGFVPTGETDEKTFEYYVGPNEQEKEEIAEEEETASVLNSLLSIFQKIIDFFSGLFGI